MNKIQLPVLLILAAVSKYLVNALKQADLKMNDYNEAIVNRTIGLALDVVSIVRSNSVVGCYYSAEIIDNVLLFPEIRPASMLCRMNVVNHIVSCAEAEGVVIDTIEITDQFEDFMVGVATGKYPVNITQLFVVVENLLGYIRIIRTSSVYGLSDQSGDIDEAALCLYNIALLLFGEAEPQYISEYLVKPSPSNPCNFGLPDRRSIVRMGNLFFAEYEVDDAVLQAAESLKGSKNEICAIDSTRPERTSGVEDSQSARYTRGVRVYSAASLSDHQTPVYGREVHDVSLTAALSLVNGDGDAWDGNFMGCCMDDEGPFNPRS